VLWGTRRSRYSSSWGLYAPGMFSRFRPPPMPTGKRRPRSSQQL
jgi:hypothetical protein